MLERPRGELITSAIEELTPANHQPTCSQLNYLCENSIDVPFAHIKNVKLKPESLGRGLHTLSRLFGDWIGRVNEKRDDLCRGNKFVQHFQPFRRDLNSQLGYARYIAARVAVAAFAASAAGVPVAAITATLR